MEEEEKGEGGKEAIRSMVTTRRVGSLAIIVGGRSQEDARQAAAGYGVDDSVAAACQYCGDRSASGWRKAERRVVCLFLPAPQPRPLTPHVIPKATSDKETRWSPRLAPFLTIK